MSKHYEHTGLCALIAIVSLLAAGTASPDVRAVRTSAATTFSDRLSPADGLELDVPSERAAVTTARLQGRWLAQTDDGATTMLDLRPSGAFSFDRQSGGTPERDYLCGDWSLARGELSLVVSTQKMRLATGEIRQSETRQVRSFTVLAARSDVLILRSDEQTLTFRRRGA